MDMMSSLSTQRMQLSADPADWCWVRWYWCQPGARTLPVQSAFGQPLWDDPVRNEVAGPQIYLDGGRYATSAVSRYPGTDFRGDTAWYQTGLPRAARRPGPTGAGCHGDVWDVRTAVTAYPVTELFPGEDMVAAGGRAQGGPAVQGGGLRQLAGGGRAQGGPADQGGGGVSSADGGRAQGGSAALASGYAITGDGGRAQGGPADQAGGYLFSADGGRAQGGPAVQGGGGSGSADGGRAQGGSAALASGYAITGDGGRAQGGAADQAGGYLFSADGGRAQGGPAVTAGGYLFSADGGRAQGGPAVQGGGLRQLAGGGRAQGGPAVQGGGGLVAAAGGQAQGGSADQSGSGGVEVPLASQYVATSESRTSTSYGDLATAETITFTLAATTTVLVVYQAEVAIPASLPSEAGFSEIMVDGSLVSGTEEQTLNAANTSARLETGCRYSVSLAAGSHTIKVQHKTGQGNSVSWKNRLLVAWAA